jgi:hypothetical protein
MTQILLVQQKIWSLFYEYMAIKVRKVAWLAVSLES